MERAWLQNWVVTRDWLSSKSIAMMNAVVLYCIIKYIMLLLYYHNLTNRTGFVWNILDGVCLLLLLFLLDIHNFERRWNFSFSFFGGRGAYSCLFSLWLYLFIVWMVISAAVDGGKLIGYFNLPWFAWGSAEMNLGDTMEYNTLVRVTSPYDRLATAIIKLFVHYNVRPIGFVFVAQLN